MKLGSQKYKLTLEQMQINFSEKISNKEFYDKYEAYKYITNSENAENMFHFNDEMYLVNYTLGDSNGFNENILYKLMDGELIPINSFKSQNRGFGEVVNLNDDYYYVFLEYNYNLKNYSGVRIYKLGENSEKENISIKYLQQNKLDRIFFLL